MRVKITLACTECKQRNYNTKKNKKNDPERLERNKYCRFCHKHPLHKESKKLGEGEQPWLRTKRRHPKLRKFLKRKPRQ